LDTLNEDNRYSDFVFVATRTVHMELGDEMHPGANILFVHPPSVARQIIT